MSNLTSLIKSQKFDHYTSLFKGLLHHAPYHLRYSLDKNRKHLIMIHTTPLSDLNNKVVQECNGIILDNRDYSVVSYGLDVLADCNNEGDLSELFKRSKVPLTSIVQSEDGSMLKVFYHKNEWIVSTSKRIDATRVRWSSSETFYQLLEKHLKVSDLSGLFEKDLDKDCTYSFILTGPDNFHVIEYPESNLFLVHVRNNTSFKEKGCVLDWATCNQKNQMLHVNYNGTDWTCIHNGCTEYFSRLLSSQRYLQDLDQDYLYYFILDNFNELFIIGKRKSCGDDTIQETDLFWAKNFKYFFSKRSEKIRGYIITDIQGKRYKYDLEWFKNVQELRYNMPTLYLSYLACDYHTERFEFKKAFGNVLCYQEIDDSISKLIDYSYRVYIDSRVKKRYLVSEDDPIYYIMSRLDYLYKSKMVPITRHDVKVIMNVIPCKTMEYILNGIYFN